MDGSMGMMHSVRGMNNWKDMFGECCFSLDFSLGWVFCALSIHTNRIYHKHYNNSGYYKIQGGCSIYGTLLQY